jgi:hypothetical protein
MKRVLVHTPHLYSSYEVVKSLAEGDTPGRPTGSGIQTPQGAMPAVGGHLHILTF